MDRVGRRGIQPGAPRTLRATSLSTFAVLTDTHHDPENETSSSPLRANRFADRRAAAVVARIDALSPDFVIHLGYVVLPVPGQPGFAPAVAVARFRAIFAALEAPIRCLPGNHDIGDKPTDRMPAPVVARPALAARREALGPDREAFDHAECRVVLLHAMLLDSGLPDEDAQLRWLETEALPLGAGWIPSVARRLRLGLGGRYARRASPSIDAPAHWRRRVHRQPRRQASA